MKNHDFGKKMLTLSANPNLSEYAHTFLFGFDTVSACFRRQSPDDCRPAASGIPIGFQR